MTRWSWRPGAAWLDPEPVWSHQADKMTRVGLFGNWFVRWVVGSLIDWIARLVHQLIDWLFSRPTSGGPPQFDTEPRWMARVLPWDGAS